jgi:hypothetical protein
MKFESSHFSQHSRIQAKTINDVLVLIRIKFIVCRNIASTWVGSKSRMRKGYWELVGKISVIRGHQRTLTSEAPSKSNQATFPVDIHMLPRRHKVRTVC